MTDKRVKSLFLGILPVAIVAVCGAAARLMLDAGPSSAAAAPKPRDSSLGEPAEWTTSGSNPFFASVSVDAMRSGDAPLDGSAIASVDDDIRFSPTTRPGLPVAQHPPEPTTQNTDTGKPPREWQRLTDDWFGARPKLEERGITFQGSLATYVGTNLTGGASTARGGGAYLLNTNFTLDSKKLAGYDGGTFFINFRDQQGLQHSMDGAFGKTSHLYVPDRAEVSEIWYEQKLLDEKLRIRAGKIDANSEFDVIDNGGEFLNDFGSASSTILGFPTDPDPAFGADVFIYPNKHFFGGVGVYDGSLLQGVPTGLLGPARSLHPSSVFLIGQAGCSWTLPNSRDGRLGIGLWHHSATFNRFDGGRDSGATGPFASFDQMLWRKNPEKEGDKAGIAMFATGGYANPAVSSVNYQFAAGVKWTGVLPSREDDTLGIGGNYNRFSGAAGAGFDHRDEVSIEAFYKLRFSSWFSIQPDLQYVHNPGGVAGRNDAVAATIQALIDF